MYLHYVSVDNKHDCDFIQDRPNGIVDFLFLCIKSKSTLIINESNYIINTPSVILFDSYTPHKYFPSGTKYIDDYLHFAVKDPDSFVKELTFPFNIPIPLSNYSTIQTLLTLIIHENQPENKYSTQIISTLIKALMLKVGEQWNIVQHESILSPHYHDLLTIRNQITQHPEKMWTVEDLAEQAHLSHAYFQVLYKKAFGTTCMNDVISAKISQAKTYLTSTDLPIYQIALEVGYNEVPHFIRQFKKSTGLTPGSFRKKASHHPDDILC